MKQAEVEVMEPLVVSKQEAARILQCSVRSIERMVEDGRLTRSAVPGFRVSVESIKRAANGKDV